MSELKQKIQSRIKEAMKAREQDTVTTLRGLSAAIKQYEVDSREDVDDERVIGIVQKEVKKLRDALEFAEQQKREDLIAKNKQEIALLQEFLGAQLSEDDLRNVIQELIASGSDSIGAIMGQLNKEYKGQFEGKIASQIVKELLA